MRSVLQQVIINVLGCIAFLFIPIIFSPDFNRSENLFAIHPFQKEFVTHVLLLGFFYLNFFLLIPKLYFTKKYIQYWIIITLCFICIPLIPGIFITDDFSNSVVRKFHSHHDPPAHHLFNVFLRSFLQFIIVLVLSLTIKIYTRWKKTEKEKLNTELSYLKAQINPHFLFNTLNSIYAMAIEKSDYTSTAIVKLSNMMRYVITEVNNDFVSLEKEIDYIRDYIDLQKVRLGATVDLSYQVTIENKFQKIAPMLLIPFIENAFKYGVNTDEYSKISIDLAVDKNELNLLVSNKKVPVHIDPLFKTGLGLENTKTRLTILYPDKHVLRIKDTEQEFSVRLTLDLT